MYTYQDIKLPFLQHAGKKGMKWGYNDGERNGKRTAQGTENALETLSSLFGMDAAQLKSLYDSGLTKGFNSPEFLELAKKLSGGVLNTQIAMTHLLYRAAQREQEKKTNPMLQDSKEKGLVGVLTDFSGAKEEDIKKLQEIGAANGYDSKAFLDKAEEISKGDDKMRSTMTYLMKNGDSVFKASLNQKPDKAESDADDETEETGEKSKKSTKSSGSGGSKSSSSSSSKKKKDEEDEEDDEKKDTKKTSKKKKKEDVEDQEDEEEEPRIKEMKGTSSTSSARSKRSNNSSDSNDSSDSQSTYRSNRDEYKSPGAVNSDKEMKSKIPESASYETTQASKLLGSNETSKINETSKTNETVVESQKKNMSSILKTNPELLDELKTVGSEKGYDSKEFQDLLEELVTGKPSLARQNEYIKNQLKGFNEQQIKQVEDALASIQNLTLEELKKKR